MQACKSLGKCYFMVFGHPQAIQLPYLSEREHVVYEEEHSKFRDTDEVLLIQNTHHC